MTDTKCIHSECGNAIATFESEEGRPLCDYHADGQRIIEALEGAIRAMLSSKRHGFSASLDTLDTEVTEVRELYGIPEPK